MTKSTEVCTDSLPRIKESSNRPAIYQYSEKLPPHLRAPALDLVEELQENKMIDLSLKLSDLGEESWFAINFNFLKSSPMTNLVV